MCRRCRGYCCPPHLVVQQSLGFWQAQGPTACKIFACIEPLTGLRGLSVTVPLGATSRPKQVIMKFRDTETRSRPVPRTGAGKIVSPQCWAFKPFSSSTVPVRGALVRYCDMRSEPPIIVPANCDLQHFGTVHSSEKLSCAFRKDFGVCT